MSSSAPLGEQAGSHPLLTIGEAAWVLRVGRYRAYELADGRLAVDGPA
jgi:hypothetical protein